MTIVFVPCTRQYIFSGWLHVLLTPASPASMAEAPKAAPPTPPKAPSAAAPRQAGAPGGPPTDLGPGYKVERQIGTGSFATVWLATKDRTPVAVKAVDRSRLTKKLRANLDDEIKILGSVKHPNLVAFVEPCLDRRGYMWCSSFWRRPPAKIYPLKVAKESTVKVDRPLAVAGVLWSRSAHAIYQNLLLTEV